MLLTFIKLSFVIKIFVLSIFEWPFYTGFTAHSTNFVFVHYIPSTKSFSYKGKGLAGLNQY